MFLDLFLGVYIGLFEIMLFFIIGFALKLTHKNFGTIDAFTYYWSLMTILTLIWEVCFISNYKNTNIVSTALLKNKEHVWTNSYDLTYLVPWKFSEIFYAEYGAYADKEYMTIRNDWSRIIEGSHAIFCGLFVLLAFIYKLKDLETKYKISLGVGMGAQLMNSILYMGNYFIQCKDPSSLNFNTTQFPTGNYLDKRPFMYVNLFWTVMPMGIIIDLLLFLVKQDRLHMNAIKNKSDKIINEMNFN